MKSLDSEKFPGTLIIRTDSTSRIGTGHIMRCIALGQAWKRKLGSVLFVSHCKNKELKRRILKEGFGFVSVEQPHPDPADLKQILGLLQDVPSSDRKSWLVLDGYHFGPDYQRSVRKGEHRLLVIDDYNHLPRYHADILLNQNIRANRFQYACDLGTVLLLGTEYALLRREFLAWKDHKCNVPSVSRKVLVTLGGMAPDNIMFKVANALNLIDIQDLEVNIVVGSGNFHLKKVEKESQRDRTNGHTFRIVRNGDMPKLMAWTEAAISAGGSTCWELSFMGVPFLVGVLTENQKDIADGLAEASAAVNCGWFNDLSTKRLLTCIEEMIFDRDTREQCIKNAKKLVDGKGGSRVVACMMEY